MTVFHSRQDRCPAGFVVGCSVGMRHLRFLQGLNGPPLSLARPLDRVSEWWWRLPPRGRALTVIAALMTAVLFGSANLARSPYGPEVSVFVATRDLPAGHQLAANDLRREAWPQKLVPHAPLTSPEGRLGSALPAGTVATLAHLAEEGIAAGLVEGYAAVAVAADLLPLLGVGNRATLVHRDIDGHATVLTTDAQVLALD